MGVACDSRVLGELVGDRLGRRSRDVDRRAGGVIVNLRGRVCEFETEETCAFDLAPERGVGELMNFDLQIVCSLVQTAKSL